MTATIVPYALTSVDKVNAHLGFTTGDDTDRDQLIADMIGEVTDYIEGYCGGRRFLSTAYTEVLDTRSSRYLFLSQRPVSVVTSVKYRSGIPSAPTWVTYDANSYLTYLGSGMIRLFAKFNPFPQAFQVVYTAGYLIDWTNYNDPTLHTLPRDLTLCASEMVAGHYNTKSSQGIYTESTEGQSITYASSKYPLDNNHKDVLKKYLINRVSVAV